MAVAALAAASGGGTPGGKPRYGNDRGPAATLGSSASGARTTGDFAVHRARRVFADAARREELDRAFEIRTAEQVAEALGQMKGALMKLGQMASYLDQGMPEHVRAALADLQHDAPPMSAELAAGDDRGGARPATRRGVRRMGPGADRGGVDRPGPPRDHPRGPRRRGEGAVPRRRRPRSRPTSATSGCCSPGWASSSPASTTVRWSPSCASGCARSSTTATRRANQRAVRRLLPRPSVHPRSRRGGPSYSTRRVLTTELADGARWDEMLGWTQRGAEPRRRDDLPLRVRQPVPARGVQRRSASGQLPVPSRRPGHLPRLRAGQATSRRRPRTPSRT